MTDNRVLENYIVSVTESRRVITNAMSILSQQENLLQTIIRGNTNSNIPTRINRSNVPVRPVRPIRPIWQTRYGSQQRETVDNVLPTHPTPTTDVSLNPTEDLLFANVPEDDRYESCPITYEEFNNESEITRIRHCGHYFSRQAITRWLTTSNNCPICRHVITPDPNTNTARETMIDNMINILTRDLETNNNRHSDNSLIFHIDLIDNIVD
jgi:hypothetical protein